MSHDVIEEQCALNPAPSIKFANEVDCANSRPYIIDRIAVMGGIGKITRS